VQPCLLQRRPFMRIHAHLQSSPALAAQKHAPTAA
jgi:hypothetical protein